MSRGYAPAPRERRWALTALAGVCLAACVPSPAGAARSRVALAAGRSAQQAARLRTDDQGLYLAFCPADQEPAHIAANAARASLAARDSGVSLAAAAPGMGLAAIGARATVAMANHEGWPADECLKMDKGPTGASHTLLGLAHVHNWLLGGYGNDTFYAGEAGDVIWGDYHPEGQPESQRDYIHGGPGEDWIYSSHGYNEIWTGGGDDHLALVYGHGVVFCDGGGVKTFVMRYLPQNRPWKLVGCSHKVLVRYRA